MGDDADDLLTVAEAAVFMRLPVVWWCFAFFLLSTMTLAVVQNFSVPILKDGLPIAVLNAESDELNAFDADDLMTLESAAAQVEDVGIDDQSAGLRAGPGRRKRAAHARCAERNGRADGGGEFRAAGGRAAGRRRSRPAGSSPVTVRRIGRGVDPER